ncbi:MAG TPA: hypothetical protein ENN29_03495, partial [Candidatus Hydrogenedentes bacterium]|nr:hypothetical protein [Candidatus Hydrogenedentota bacterium]
MGKNETARAPSGRRLPGIPFVLLFLVAVLGGFVGGLYFTRPAPDNAAPIAGASSRQGSLSVERVWNLFTAPKFRGRLGQSPSPLADASPIRVYFVPSADPAASPAKEALIALIACAKESVLCAFYDFELESVAAALVERHESGVRVAVVCDSDNDSKPGVALCRQAGVPVVFDARSALMHNKFCVVDGRHVWTGSTNITSNGMFLNNNNSVLVTSAELAANFTSEFEEMFLYKQFGAGSPRNTPHPVLEVAGVGLECYFAPEDNVERAVIARLAQAREQITFMAFVLTSKPIAAVMEKRLAAGVAVRGVLERRSAGSRHSRHGDLNRLGAEIYVDGNPNTMHHKVMVLDARLVMTGSYNFSASAENRNDENLI